MSNSDVEDVIIRDSIIQNKERTKSYWEQLMMAAASENQSNRKVKAWEKADISISNSNGNRNFKQCNSSANSFYCNNSNNCKGYVKNSNSQTSKNCIRPDLSLHSLSMEDRIALELQEQKEREEELKQLRRTLSVGNAKEISSFREISNGHEELCSSIHTNDDSNYSEYGSEEKEQSLDENSSRGNTPYSEDFVHRRTQSLDSVSSGLSSGSGSIPNDKDSPKRKILVRPFEDPQEEEEVPTYKRIENETPIEREIRIAKEREEELRKEKGIAINSSTKAEQIMLQRSFNRRDAVENDPRDLQHRLATNRIQHEIEEANERENELRTEGKILTTSEETLDAKVTRFTQLAEYAILENRHKDSRMKRSLSVNLLHLADDSSADFENGAKKSYTPVKTSDLRIKRRYAANPAQRGIMQRFIATKGRMSAPILTANSQNIIQDKASHYSLNDLSSYDSESFLQGGRGPPRKGYVPAGEKIQEELKEMEKREEELRVQRAHNPVSSMTVRHRSQPNLLNIFYDENNHEDAGDAEEELHSWTSHNEHAKVPLRLSHSLSNPNLLHDGLEKINVRLPHKRFSLLQQWENRIQDAQS